jgi:hypothetical protein
MQTPPFDCQQVAFQRGARAVGNYRCAVPVAERDGRRDLFGGFGEDHRVGWHGG